jgi:cytochrome c2
MPTVRLLTDPGEVAMGKKWFVASMLAALACFTIPRPGRAQAPSLSRGKETFEKRCGGCHSLDRDKEGPRLRGVYGRPSGSVSSFSYSTALKSAHISWDAESLDKWLTDPDKVVPDTDMAFHVDKADERRDIIAYLKDLSGK